MISQILTILEPRPQIFDLEAVFCILRCPYVIVLSFEMLRTVLRSPPGSLALKNSFFEKLYKFEGSGATDDTFRRGSNFSIFGAQNSER